MTDCLQTEADLLLAMEKQRLDEREWQIPADGVSLAIPLTSLDRREQFSLDIWRQAIVIAKVRYQHRARKVIILARLDLGGAPHTNPDGAKLPCPHLHLYREGFGDRWAFPLPSEFTNPKDLWHTLDEFMAFCHIVLPPIFQRSLW